MFPGSLIKRVNAPSTRFTIEYDDGFRAHYREAELGAGAMIKATDLPLSWIRDDAFIHIAPMNPPKVRKLVERIRRASKGAKVSINSNITYMSSARNRRILLELAKEADLFVVDDREAMALSGASSLTQALRLIEAKRLAVTLGQIGAIFVEGGDVRMVPALSGAVPTPKDTTGAGDTWCGSLIAAYSICGDWLKSVVAACIISALKCMSWGFERIRGLRFNGPDEAIEYVLSLRDGSGQLSLKNLLDAEASFQ